MDKKDQVIDTLLNVIEGLIEENRKLKQQLRDYEGQNRCDNCKRVIQDEIFCPHCQ